jgi:thiamine-phosphate diphosphorylase
VTPFRRRSITLVTDRRRLAPDARTAAEEVRALEGLLDSAVDAGVDYIQLRERDLDARRLVHVASRAVQRMQGSSTVLLVNDRCDVALASGAGGVHLRSDGPEVGVIRELSESWMIGRSVHAGDVVSSAAEPNYLIFGTVFPSASKPALHRTAGVDALAKLARENRRPVVAIGGITPDNAAEAARAGAAGVAAIGVFLPEGRVPGALGVRRAMERFRAIAAFRNDLLE